MQSAFLSSLNEAELLALPYLFEFWALPHQITPEGRWRNWIIMGGRGAGKTRAGAEWVRSCVEGAGPRDAGRCARIALVGETVAQVREVMIFGESGILACSPPDRRPEWQASRGRLLWPNGAVAQVFSAHEPEALRGPQFDGAWVDELAKWKKARETWDAVLPDEASQAVAASELPLVMRRGAGRQIVERWLSEARVARDTLRFALPPSKLDVAAGDVLRLQFDGIEQLLRVDRVEIGTEQMIEAVRIESETYNPVDLAEDAPLMSGFTPALPVFPLFLDLPLMRGDEVPHAPHLAVTAEPWPGSAALYTSSDGDSYQFDRLIVARSTLGVLETPLGAACPGLYDRGSRVNVRLTSGSLVSVTELAMLNGANLAAIGDGSPENWELVQFQNAELVADKTYALTRLLRGQLGSDAWQPSEWPAGSYFVLLDGRPKQVDLQASERGLERFYRVGPASRASDDASYTGVSQAFDGVGLRPLSPCHLRVASNSAGHVASWIRRTRVGGDSWEAFDVPLGEESERYLVRVSHGAQVVRESVVTGPTWSYTAAEAAADGAGGGFQLSVAQLSAVYGVGAFAHVDISL